MYTTRFEYHRASSIDEALSLLGQYGEDAKLLAGGHSLIPVMKLRFAQPKHLIDIRRVDGLRGIREEDGALIIGAATTHYEVESSDLVRSRAPALAEAAAVVGDPQVRNMGTIGGSLVHADPGADTPAPILALEAELSLVGPNGERTVPAADFFQGLMMTAVGPDELLTSIRIPARDGAGQAYVEKEYLPSGFALVGVAAVVARDGSGTVRHARLGLTGLASAPRRLNGVEEAIQGTAGDEAAIEAASARAGERLTLQTDRQGGAEYKAQLARVYTRRALRAALDRAG